MEIEQLFLYRVVEVDVLVEEQVLLEQESVMLLEILLDPRVPRLSAMREAIGVEE